MSQTTPWHKFLALDDPAAAARWLLGRQLVREIDGVKLVGKIIETEAYHQSDPASHAYRGQTRRNAAMFGAAGHAYVYFIYGLHYCFNVTAGGRGEGAAVLIRALEPLAGLATMRQHRGGNDDTANLCSGPAKLTQALAIDRSLNGHDLTRPPLYITGGEEVAPAAIHATGRIGITHSLERPLRFYIKGNPFISRK